MDPLLIFIISIVLAVIFLAVGIGISIASNRNAANERLEKILSDEAEETNVIPENMLEEAQAPLVDWLNRSVEGSSWAEKTAKSLAQADLKMKPGEYLVFMIIVCVGLGLFLWYVGGQSIIAGIIGAVVGFFLPGIYVKRAQDNRLQTFDNQLGDMLNLMVNGLRAGYSTMQAMEAVSREMPPPISDEFHRVVQEMQLGVQMETALANFVRRIPSADLDLVVTSINVQREVGGNLAEMLDTISYTIRERVRIKGEIKTLTTQVLYSGRFLAMMPLIVMGILFVLNREYMMQFFLPENNMAKYPIPCGYCSLVVAAVLIGLGYMAMNKLADIEV
ncbi:MAG: type II secretion system F family protein [Anaerolineaceae bacterium]|nr:type II secretion system F family protein [Anaerolineaceae bacterium]